MKKEKLMKNCVFIISDKKKSPEENFFKDLLKCVWFYSEEEVYYFVKECWKDKHPTVPYYIYKIKLNPSLVSVVE